MHTPNDIWKMGITKLAFMPEKNTLDPNVLGQIISTPGRALSVASTGTFSVPTPHEADTMNAYTRSGIVGGLSGAALATLLAAVTKRPVLPHMGVGLGSGILSGIARQYDQSSDPPGLSPVYTIPSGLRLGALTGMLAGGPLGRLTGAGVLPGIISGTLSGSVSGGAVSSFL